MQYEVVTDRDSLRIVLANDLSLHDTDRFAEVLNKAQNSNTNRCQVDFSRLDQIDSSGLRMLLLLYGVCRKIGSALSFHSAGGQVRDMLINSRFETIVPVEA